MFSNKKILITGADGFIGSHLVDSIMSLNGTVKALSQYNSFNSCGWLDKIDCNKNIEILSGDIRDPHFCKKITKDVDIIFHLAALIAIPYSYQSPSSYLETNIQGTLNMCQAALENNCDRIVHTSTSEVYGTAKYIPIDEKHPLQAQSPYSASKIGADAMAMSFYYAYDLPLTIARPFNTYGPRQSARAIIPTIITQIAAGNKQIKVGDLSPTRDFTFVKDTCKGLTQIALSPKTIGETINIGSNYEILIKDLLQLIKKLMKSDVQFITEEKRLRPKKSEVLRLWCDNSKIKHLTNFEPDYSLEEGLLETINWFSEAKNLSQYKPNIYNV
jgi:NAD dependent epimerase/dehydratase